MRSYSRWLMLLCLSVAACSDDKSGSSEEAVSEADASTSDSTDSNSGKKSGSAGKSGAGGSGTGKASAGAGGKAAPSSGDSKSASASGDAKSDNAKKQENASNSEGNKENAKPDDKKSEANDNKGEATDSGKKTDEGASNNQTTLPTNGDQLSVCSRAEGDCNKGLACHAPATVGSPGRGFCSKICESDADCGGVSPEGTKYTCTTGNATNTCEIVCNGTEDTSCPSGLTCVQTGRGRTAAATRRAAAGAGGEGMGGAGGSAAPQGEFRCRYPREVSKLWGQCGDAQHECDKDLFCQGFWFGGVGHCTRSCEKDEDCAKPESGNTKPTCQTLVPAFGDTPAVKQCALSCAEAKEDCPNGLACIEQWQPRAEARDGGAEQAPTLAWCQ